MASNQTLTQIEIARHRLEIGEEYPFDQATPSKGWAHKAARGIIADLSDRRGIKHAFNTNEIDEDVRIELVESLTAIILLAALDGDKAVSEQEPWRVGLNGVIERLTGCIDPYTKYNTVHMANTAYSHAIAEIKEVLNGTSPGMQSAASTHTDSKAPIDDRFVVKMTIDECLAFADEWVRGMTFHAGSNGWRVVCMLLAREVRSLRLASQVPDGYFFALMDALRIERGSKQWEQAALASANFAAAAIAESNHIAFGQDDLSKCPKCGGEADNGHDRCVPPSAYYCKKCSNNTEQEK
jgi:hypothetical protein